MSHIDSGEVDRVMRALPEVLAQEELVVHRTLPRLSPADALDTALKRSLARLRFQLNQDTFEYLRWKVSSARDESERLRASMTLSKENAMLQRAAMLRRRESPGSTPRSRCTRTFKSEYGVVWTVSALTTLTPSDPQHATCLVFSSEETVTCVWEYPERWSELSDGELDTLRQRR